MNQRTLTQNKALHKYFELLAEALNDSGWEMKKVLAVKSVDVPWSKESIKSVLWKPIQEAMIEKPSTADMDTKDVDDVYRVLDRHLSQNFGVSIPFPTFRGE